LSKGFGLEVGISCSSAESTGKGIIVDITYSADIVTAMVQGLSPKWGIRSAGIYCAHGCAEL